MLQFSPDSFHTFVSENYNDFDMKRDILKIDEDLCNGCGLCVPNCHEGALQVIDGKVRLVSELLCDGLGACIGHCPEGAIAIEKRDAEPYNEMLVMEQMKDSGCPGSREQVIERLSVASQVQENGQSELRQWPVQMHLINPNASYFQGSDLLLAADCVAYSMGGFHSRYLKGKSLAIACPKLDQHTEIYIEKLAALIDTAKINTMTVMLMEVPCCGGLMQMVKAASGSAARKVPVKLIMVSISGEILKEEWV